MKIAFFGTSDKSIPILEGLSESQFDVSLCVTKNDVKVGRSQKLKPTAVKTWAIDNGVQVVTLDRLDPKSTSYLKKMIHKMSIDVCIVADFSFMIPEDLLNFPKHKFVNIHFSLLPSYRGASPVQFAILNKEKITGISYLVVTKGMDEGPIISQTKYKLNGSETSAEVYKTLFEISANEFPNILSKYTDGKLKPTEQDHTAASYTYSPSHPKQTHIFKEDGEINWNDSTENIDAKVRAFNPWPTTWTTLGELAEHLNLKTNKDKDLILKIHKGGIKNSEFEILEIQPENKNKMDWKDFENGYVISADTV